MAALCVRRGRRRVPWRYALEQLGYSDAEIVELIRKHQQRVQNSTGRGERRLRSCGRRQIFSTPHLLHLVALLKPSLVRGLYIVNEFGAHSGTLAAKLRRVKRTAR